MILVDSSVLIDVIEEQDVRWADWSQAQMIYLQESDISPVNT